jgi:hypothetical protein
VVEPRLGALGTDGHEITYGLPANNALNSAAHLIPNTPVVPTIPEIALAKRNDKVGAAKLAVYAYDNKTKERNWQSGISLAVSRKRDFWVMGAGPFQRGTIYDGTKFAGSDLAVPFADGQDDPAAGLNVVFSDEKYFGKARKGQAESQEVDFEEIVPLEDPAPVAEPGQPSGDSPAGDG